MTTFGWLGLAAVFFFTAVISVVTGGTSLITLPVILQLDIDPRIAVATNMFALIFLSLGGTLPFLKSRALPRKRLPALVAFTLVGSLLGALLLLVLPRQVTPLVIAVAMIAVALFAVAQPDGGLAAAVKPSTRASEAAGYAATFLLGVYGGFFSGGYVAILTAAYVAFFGMTFLEAVAVTKVLNLFSSVAATAIFAHEGIIDWKLGIVLGAVSFAGAVVGAVAAQRLGNVWLRQVFLTAVIALALKTLLFDVRWGHL
jgi:uncharacterized membrane protein YfcA